MATFKLVMIEHKARRNGECPIHLRITEDRKPRYVSTGIFIQPKHWNADREQVRKSNRSYETYNLHLDVLKRKAIESWINMRNGHGGTVTSAMIKDEITGRHTTGFFPFAEGVIQDFDKRDQFVTAKKFKTTISRLKDFAGASLTFEQITPKLLREFETHLRSEHKNKSNTVHKAMECIKRIFNIAIDEGEVSADVSPFRTYKVKRTRTDKTRLSFEQIKAIEDLDLKPDTAIWNARNYFMFSFFVGGMRFADICTLQWRNIQGDRLKYKMGKTGTGKDVLITKQAKDILQYYRPDESPEPSSLVFPILRNDRDYSDIRYLKRQISSRNVIVNKNLKQIAELAGIDENLSFHVSRHSWSDYARRKGMSVYDISKVLGHSSLKVTEGYLASFDTDGVDEKMSKLYD